MHNIIYKSAMATNFKCYYEPSTFNFTQRSLITGYNASGKTSVLDLINWILIDKDMAGKSNPLVATIGHEDEPTLGVLLVSINGETHTLSKKQTRTKEGSKTKTVNEYSIDEVPKKKSEYLSSLSDMGIDLDLYPALSDINAFTKGTSDSQRSVLMGMARDLSIKEIATELGYTDLATELDKKCIGDIKAIADSKRKSVESVHGKKGELTTTKLAILQEALNLLNEINANKKSIDVVEGLVTTYKKKQSQFEQDLADAQRTLYQIDTVKSKLIGDSQDAINSHFKNVSFKVWDIQKDGTVVPCCKAMVGDYELGSSTNTALEYISKVEIINGLSEFYECRLPILIDGAEALDNKSIKQIASDCQLIMAKVSNTPMKIK